MVADVIKSGIILKKLALWQNNKFDKRYILDTRKVAAIVADVMKIGIV